MKRNELKARLAPLRSSSRPFLVEACGIQLEMRVLSNEDAQAVQQLIIDYSKVEVDEKDADATDKRYRQISVELQYHMKIETIARAVVSIDGMRDGIVTDDDTGDKVELRDFLREEVTGWDRPVTEEIYTAYGLKAMKEEIRQALQVQYEPVDFSLEVQRLEKLLEKARRGVEQQRQALEERAEETQELADIESTGPTESPAVENPPEEKPPSGDPEVFGGAPERVMVLSVEPTGATGPAEAAGTGSNYRDRIPRGDLVAPPPGRASVGPPAEMVLPVPQHLGGGSFLGDDPAASIEEAERQQLAMRMRRPQAPVERGTGSLDGEDGLSALKGVAIPGQGTPVPARQRPAPPSRVEGPRLPPDLPVNQRPGEGAINPRFRGR